MVCAGGKFVVRRDSSWFWGDFCKACLESLDLWLAGCFGGGGFDDVDEVILEGDTRR